MHDFRASDDRCFLSAAGSIHSSRIRMATLRDDGSGPKVGKSIPTPPRALARPKPPAVQQVSSSPQVPVAAHSAPSLEMVGRTLSDRYILDNVIGEGGMGHIYRARDRAHGGAVVAVKVLRADMSQDEEVTTRFFNEAKAASSVGNPHIVSVSDFGRLADGTTYYVMEFLDGLRLNDVQRNLGIFPLGRLIHVARQIARGVGAAHNIGIVHRDIKPENVMIVDRDGDSEFVKILDFGIAKVGSQASRLTRAGSVFGTPQYMSPEQAAGVSVDHRSDIYALGILMYEMASGRVPFDDENVMTVLSQHMFHSLPPLRRGAAQDLPPAFEAIVKKCLAKTVEARYASMDDVVADLDALETGLPPQAFQELSKDSERFAAPAPYGPRNVLTATNLTAPTARPSYIFPILGVATAAVLAVAVGLAIISRVRANAADADNPTTAAAELIAAGRNSAAPLEPASGSASLGTAAAAPVPMDVTVRVTPKTARVMQDDAVLVVHDGEVVLRLAPGATANLLVSAPGYVSRDVTVGTQSREVVFALDAEKVVAAGAQHSATGSNGTKRPGAPTAASAAKPPPLSPEAACKAQHRTWDGFACL
jgi:eukaryotic-like serine/threonine-protein kinase